MADPCDKIRNKVAELEQKIADLKGDIEGATGSVLHSLAGKLALARAELARELDALAACEQSPAAPSPPARTTPSLAHEILNLNTLSVSGTYVSNAHIGRESTTALAWFETIRLDVDGSFPQMMASGSYQRTGGLFSGPTSWVAHPLRQIDSSNWEGPILQVWGDTSLIPHKTVHIHVPRSQVLAYFLQMTVTFMNGAPAVTRKVDYVSPWFREVAFEFDTVQGSPQITSANTCAHNEHPPYLPCEILTFDKVYDRAGVDVSHSKRSNTVPLSLAGGDQAWSDAELQAAIRAYWSSYSDAPNWAVWVLFAGTGRTLSVAGSMFDDSDANQRQGVGIFNDAAERYVPNSYPQRPEHLRRERFFALIHEVGHCFNLHHAWLFYNSDLHWPFFDDTGDSATFMNYPNRVVDFYNKFRYTFHASDLKFLRHAPDQFVEMGDYRFRGGQDEFGREARRTLPPWTLDIGLSRSAGVFQFLEPVTLTATLTNSSSHPQIVDESVMEDSDNFRLLISKSDGGPSRIWRPFVLHCFRSVPRVLQAGESLKTPFFVGAGLDGWYLAEPGVYTLRAMLSTPQFTVNTNPRRVRIAHPRSWEEETLAQEFFTKDVGRAFAFGASHGITAPVETLKRVMDQLPDRAVSRHAALALAEPLKRPTRVLRMDKQNRGFDIVKANPEEARGLYTRALHDDTGAADRCFGKSRYDDLSRDYRKWLEENGASTK
jgi:hypothetical protein